MFGDDQSDRDEIGYMNRDMQKIYIGTAPMGVLLGNKQNNLFDVNSISNLRSVFP